jgi:hypothetical protein
LNADTARPAWFNPADYAWQRRTDTHSAPLGIRLVGPYDREVERSWAEVIPTDQFTLIRNFVFAVGLDNDPEPIGSRGIIAVFQAFADGR